MAKLITEYTDWQDLQVLKEGDQENKVLKIKGPFVQANIKNKNGRIYEKSILENEVNRFKKEKIERGNAYGELDHPISPTINMQQVSHIIESLQMEGDDGMGVARIMDTPNGKIVKSILEAGGTLGVSSRGVGSLDGDKVQKDFILLTVDIVADPSAPLAFVDGVLENKEYIIEGNMIVEMAVDQMEKTLSKKGSREIYHTLREFLNTIRGEL